MNSHSASSSPSSTLDLRPPSWFGEDGENSREIAIDDPLKELCYSIVAKGLLQPIGAIDHGDRGTPIFGFRRLAAIRFGISQGLAVPEKVPTLLFPPTITRSQIKVINLTENIHRANLKGFEMFSACKGLLDLNPQWQAKDLAEHLNRDPSQICRIMSASKVSNDWLEALKAESVTISDIYAASKLDEPGQAGLLALKLSGQITGREGMERQARKKRESNTPVVRASKIKCPLVSGSIVTVAGDDISLDDALEAMKEATKAMAKARDQGLDAKTAQAVWKDLAAAG